MKLGNKDYKELKKLCRFKDIEEMVSSKFRKIHLLILMAHQLMMVFRLLLFYFLLSYYSDLLLRNEYSVLIICEQTK